MVERLSGFTNYETALSQISKALDQGKTAAIERFVFVLHGPRGVGKSTLLQSICDAQERVIPGSLVTMQGFDWRDTDCALCPLLTTIIGDIIVPRLLPRINSPSNYKDSTNEEQLIKHLLDLVEAAAKRRMPTLLLLDDYDAMPAKLKSRFETKILSELGKTHTVVVILTSEFEEKFQSNFDLRMRYESFQLSGLSLEDIGCEFEGYVSLAPAIHRLTGGLPGLVKAFIGLLEKLEIKDLEGLQLNYDTVLEGYYGTIVPESVEKYVPSNTRETLLALALLRRFDLRVLQHILPGELPESYSGYSPIDYLNLIEELGNWTEWRAPRNGYIVNQAYQPVLSGYMWLNFPDRYKNVHRAALTLYRNLLQNEYRASYVTEMLYHRLTLLLFEHSHSWTMPKGDINIAIDEFLKDINGSAMTRITEDDLLPLYRALTHDEDLMTYLSPKDVRIILSTLYESSKGIPAPVELFKDSSVLSN